MSVITDPIGDMLTRIKNAYRAKKASVLVPHSNVKEAIAKVLERRGYVGDIEKKGKKMRKFLEITLKYNDDVPALSDAQRISKPSRRMYQSVEKIRSVKSGYGTLILSTSQGVLSGEEAKEKRVGGEIIAEVW